MNAVGSREPEQPGGGGKGDHAGTDNAAVEAQARATQDAYNAEMNRRWAADHAAKYTVETCRVTNGCPVHGK